MCVPGQHRHARGNREKRERGSELEEGPQHFKLGGSVQCGALTFAEKMRQLTYLDPYR